MGGEPDIICEKRGAAGLIVLNRPQALNALNLTMVRAMASALDTWAVDPGIRNIVVMGAGEKAFCAGGDIRALHDLGRSGAHEEALGFWREEYELNIRIKTYPKPYIALMDGIVMGGGVGVSLHGSHRVAGDKTLFAMPEVGIGFFPDVGATFVLPRLHGRAGEYLALTGARIKTADAVALGLATTYVPSERMPALLEDLLKGEAPADAISRHNANAGLPPLRNEEAVIEEAFGQETLTGIFKTLERLARESHFAADTLATMRTKSPTSLAIAHEQMRIGPSLDFVAAMNMEFRIVSRILEGHDFYEGVRAVIIDKDQKPVWVPSRIEDVKPQDIAAYFAPLPHGELRGH